MLFMDQDNQRGGEADGVRGCWMTRRVPAVQFLSK